MSPTYTCLYMPTSTHPSIHPFIHPSIYPYIHNLPIHSFFLSLIHSYIPGPFIHPPIHLSIHPSINPPIHPSIHPSIHLFIQAVLRHNNLYHNIIRYIYYLGTSWLNVRFRLIDYKNSIGHLVTRWPIIKAITFLWQIFWKNASTFKEHAINARHVRSGLFFMCIVYCVIRLGKNAI